MDRKGKKEKGNSLIKDKRGELTSKQLVTIIILIVSFAIIILFFVMLGLRKTIDTETCRNSVILRGSIPLGKDTVQLKCKTTDICLSMGGDCDVIRKGLVTIKVDNENELIKEMVTLLWDCWWMMGEGKVDYASAGLGFQEPYCTICNKVYFDDKIKAEYTEGIPYSKIYDYMQSTKVPERDETFLFSIYRVNSLDRIRGEILANHKYDIYKQKLNPSKEHVTITATVKEGWAKSLISAGVGIVVGGGALILAPVSLGTSVVVGGALIGGAIGMGIGSIGGDATYLAPIYLEFKGDSLEALDCKEYVSEG